MANICNFSMRIQGDNKAVAKLCDMLAWQGDYEENGFQGRVEHFEVDETGDGWARGYGWCDWSVQTALIDDASPDLVEETARLGVAVEIYSYETDTCFQEHFIICNGEIIEGKSVFYFEYDIFGDEDIEFVANYFEITTEEVKNNLDEDHKYIRGGFDNREKFVDLTPYLNGSYMEEKNIAANSLDNEEISNADFSITIESAGMDFDGYLVGAVRVDGKGPFEFTYSVGDEDLCSELRYSLEEAEFDQGQCKEIERLCSDLVADLWLEIKPAYKNALEAFNSTYVNDVVHKANNPEKRVEDAIVVFDSTNSQANPQGISGMQRCVGNALGDCETATVDRDIEIEL